MLIAHTKFILHKNEALGDNLFSADAFWPSASLLRNIFTPLRLQLRLLNFRDHGNSLRL